MGKITDWINTRARKADEPVNPTLSANMLFATYTLLTGVGLAAGAVVALIDPAQATGIMAVGAGLVLVGVTVGVFETRARRIKATREHACTSRSAGKKAHRFNPWTAQCRDCGTSVASALAEARGWAV